MKEDERVVIDDDVEEKTLLQKAKDGAVDFWNNHGKTIKGLAVGAVFGIGYGFVKGVLAVCQIQATASAIHSEEDQDDENVIDF